jgi:geranylgeranyl pyrophosphate synthase
MFYELAKPDVAEVERYIASVLEPEQKEVYGMLLPYIMRGGKRMRPMLAILSCRAVGGDPKAVIKPAGIIEMFHNFSLIHDDIADSSQFRRGEPTLHVSHGTPIALNSGDALYTLLLKELVGLDMPRAKHLELQRRYIATFKQVVEGQGAELAWERSGRFDVSEDEYLAMVNGKTSALIGLSCEMGAYMCGAPKRVCSRMARFGQKVGAAFQIHDDVLNVTGSFEKYKKEIGGDVTEGKRTLMVIHCLKHCDAAEGDRIRGILKGHSARKEDIDCVISSFQKHGSVEYAHGISARLVDEARSEISKLDASEAREALLALCDYAISRDT